MAVVGCLDRPSEIFLQALIFLERLVRCSVLLPVKDCGTITRYRAGCPRSLLISFFPFIRTQPFSNSQ